MSTYRLAEAVADYAVELSQTRLVEMVASYKTLKRANEELEYATGVTRFFNSKDELAEFQHLIAAPTQSLDSAKTREFGDFQTPPTLARQVCQYLDACGISPTVLIEPTYGLGNFVLAALDVFPNLKLVYGVELQARYEWRLKVALLIRALRGRRHPAKIELERDNIFTHEFPEGIKNAENLLILGNPPWVTSAALSALESENLPQKKNLKALNGMDALTGKSNFDISEYILLRLLDLFGSNQGTLAMLVKNATARNLVEFVRQKPYRLSQMRTLEIDAAREFNVAVDANLFVAKLGAPRAEQTCQVATLNEPKFITREFGWVGDNFVANIEAYRASRQLDGESVLVWRQGLKHDCARVMELELRGQQLWNGDEELVQVEEEYRYWLLKSSDLQSFEAVTPRKQVIVTQKKLGEDTSVFRTRAPRLWRYLVEHASYLEQRKSSIYRDKPRFSIFGIGDYSFKPYKVAISGLYKKPNFAIVCPVENRPVMLDDTCYFLGFDTYLDALITASLYNSEPVQQFLSAIVFNDAKRPFTKQALMRVNVACAMERLTLDSLEAYWHRIGYVPRVRITELDLEKYKRRIMQQQPKEDALQIRLQL